MNNYLGKYFFLVIFLTFLMSMLMPVSAADKVKSQNEKETSYSKKGADTCLKCHDEDNDYPVMPLFNTKHGERGDARSPMAGLQCETCHGQGGKHQVKVKDGEKKAPIRAFGSKAWTPPAEQNAVCMSCHNDHTRANWKGGAHENAAVVCADCHQVHARHDPMTQARTQNKKCAACHQKQRAEFQRNSSHPVRFDKIRCSQCHNPHGTFADKLVKTANKNELCYSCHAEKRGPKLWAHAPVQEDCTICHTPHGSVHGALLKKIPPLLCQQCHASGGHPSFAFDGSRLPGATPSRFLLSKSCLNCHSQIHGSNH
jgi:DmsE family decaheme c-type cytochrome